MNECLTCGSKEVNPQEVYYMGIPGMIIVPSQYHLCKEHKGLRYKYDDIYDDKGNRKEIDHQIVKDR